MTESQRSCLLHIVSSWSIRTGEEEIHYLIGKLQIIGKRSSPEDNGVATEEEVEESFAGETVDKINSVTAGPSPSWWAVNLNGVSRKQ